MVAGDVTVQWTHIEELLAGLRAYEEHLRDAIDQEGQHFANLMQGQARTNAPWNDVTGAARAGLTGIAIWRGDVLVIILANTVAYGIYLERGTTRMAPRAIVMPTLQNNYAAVMDAMRELVA